MDAPPMAAETRGPAQGAGIILSIAGGCLRQKHDPTRCNILKSQRTSQDLAR